MTWKLIIASVLVATSLAAQSAPAFDVSSVKRNMNGGTRTTFRTPAAGIVMITNATLRSLITSAYQIDAVLERFQLVVAAKTPLVHADNALDDSSAPRFDVQGTVPEGSEPGQQYAMLRTLLAERFKLRAHRELRPVPLYVLTVAREGHLGPRLLPSSVNCAAYRSERSKNPQLEEPRNADGQSLCIESAPSPGMNRRRSSGPISHLASSLQVALDRPLIDETRLFGNFTWDLFFEGRVNSFDGVGSTPLFTAVREQLGLKIEARTAPYEVIVVDSVEMPTEN